MPINASDHWPSLWHGIWYILGPPRGLLWIILRLFYIILPYELLIHPLIHTPDHLSLDLFTRCFIRTLRYTLGDRDMHRCRFLFFLIDRIHYHSCTLRGYDVRLVSDPFDGGEDVRGVWVGEKGTVPSLYMDRSSKDDLKDTLVVLYIHGTYILILSSHEHWVLHMICGL